MQVGDVGTQTQTAALALTSSVHLSGNRTPTTTLSPVTNKQCLFAASCTGMPLFEFPMVHYDYTQGNRETVISFLTGEEA